MTTARAELNGNTLVLANAFLCRTFDWNAGLLATRAIVDVARGATWSCTAAQPDCALPDTNIPETHSPALTAAEFQVESHAATRRAPAHLAASVTLRLGTLELRRVFRIYENCPAIACDYFLRGKATGPWKDDKWASGDAHHFKNYRLLYDQRTLRVPVLDRLLLSNAPHVSMTAARFFDVSDLRNNLVSTQRVIPYTRSMALAANVLLIDDVLSDRGLFFICEGPCTDVRLGGEGYDFIVQQNMIAAVGLGVAHEDLRQDEWVRGYSCVLGVAGGGELGRLEAIRAYQDTRRTLEPQRDEMIMLNTWGDRSQDTRVVEAFALAEVEAGARLGVTHLQLDDGWQKGRSLNSAQQGGADPDLGRDPAFWNIHPEKFPGGFAPLLAKAREKGIEICLWFQPSDSGHFRLWEKDADALINLYRQHGIRTFKIDGVWIHDRQADTNLRAMLDRVNDAAGGEAVFNLDVTAGTRFGYHYFNEYGNLFIENRYTDWANYYTHWTLRNLWMLSRWARPQQMQFEFLNHWRNSDKYPKDDPLAPANVPFDYCFAVTMASQPLAWFEASSLPEEAFAIAPLVKTYRAHQARLHAGRIYPIGDEPSGAGWTGFQSIGASGGYFIVYRERNDQDHAMLKTWLTPAPGSAGSPVTPGKAVHCRHILGHGQDFKAVPDDAGRVRFKLPAPFTFAMYSYE